MNKVVNYPGLYFCLGGQALIFCYNWLMVFKATINQSLETLVHQNEIIVPKAPITLKFSRVGN